MDVFLYSKLLSTIILLTHTAVLLFLVLLLIHKHTTISGIEKTVNAIKKVLQERGFLLALIVATAATISPLIYTYTYYFTPCVLCWYQRIFMFPLTVLLLIANIKKDLGIKIYIYALSAIGLIISIYHYIIQQLHSNLEIDLSGCDVVGMSESCSEYYLMEYGYITIPVMAATGFILVILLTYFSKNKQENHDETE